MITIVAVVAALLFLPYPWNFVVPIVAAIVDTIEAGVFLWWSKRRRAAVGVETLVGRRAVAVGPLAPGGQVKVDGELWEARSEAPVDPGAEVVVRAIEGLVLHVEPPDDGT